MRRNFVMQNEKCKMKNEKGTAGNCAVASCHHFAFCILHSPFCIPFCAFVLLAATCLPAAQPDLPGLPGGAAPADFPGAGLFNSNPPFLAGVKVNHDDFRYAEADKLAIEFTAEQESFLYLLYHQADGTTLLLFPNEQRSDNRIAAKKSVSVPAPDEEFRFRVRPPFGKEVLQVIATLKTAPELDALVQKTGRAARVPREVLMPLQTRLQADLTAWTEHRVPIETAARTAQPAVATPERKAARFGLFIGVNKSKKDKDEGRFRLGAELMAKTMIERGGLKQTDVKLLTNDLATKANIEAALTKWLPSVSQPGDTVFLFYAGHGGVTRNIQKPDQRNGFLTTCDDFGPAVKTDEEWDARARKVYMTDTALARWLQALPGRQIVFLMSTCHAGAMIDMDLFAKFGVREATRVKGISQTNVIVIGTAHPDESTLSPSDQHPVYLAQFLAEAVTQLPKPVTLRQAYDYYHDRMRKNLVRGGDVGFHEPVMIDTALLPIVLAP